MAPSYQEIAQAARMVAARKRQFCESRKHYGHGILERFEREARYLEWIASDCIAAADGCDASIRAVEECIADDQFDLLPMARRVREMEARTPGCLWGGAA